MSDTELVIKINGDIKGYTKALKAATKETEDLQKQLDTIAKAGAVAFAGFTATIILSTARFSEFDHGLRGVKTLLDETSFGAGNLEQGFKDMSEGALSALKKFPLELQSLNKSLFDIVSAGVSAGEAIDFLGSTSRLAVAGITDSATATDGVTSAINAYGLEAKEAELVAAKFFTAQKFGKTTIADLSKFMGEAVSSAASFGVSLDELFAATAAATSGSIKTSQAMTSLTAILSNIAKPTETAKDEAERLGVEFNSTAIRAKGLTGFLDSLTNAEDFNAQSAEKLFGSTEALKVIYTLTGNGAKKYKETLEELTNTQKTLATFTEAYETQNESLKNQTIILKNNFDALAIAVGSNYAPTMGVAADATTNFLGLLQESPALTAFASKVLLAGAVTTGLVTILGVAGVAFLKLRAIMLASAAATAGVSVAMKVLVGSTGIGLLVAFLPEIIDLLDGSLVPALAITAAGLFKTRAAMLAATTGTRSLGIAIKGLVGSTGIGLLVVFLPEIIEALKSFFGDSEELASRAASRQKNRALNQARDEKEILEAKNKGLGAEEIDFIRRRQDIRNRLRKRQDIEDKDLQAKELENVTLLHKSLIADEEKFAADKLAIAKKQGEKSDEGSKKVVDTKIRQLKNENSLIIAQLKGIEKEELAFMKRRQDLSNKAAEAQTEKGAKRRAAALENVRLLKAQLLKEEKDSAKKIKAVAEKKAKEDAEKIAKEAESVELKAAQLSAESEVLKAHLADMKEKEVSFLQKKQALKVEAIAAEQIKDKGNRDLALENNQLKNDLLLEEEALFREELTEARAEQQEIDMTLAEELNQLSREQREALKKEDIDSLKSGLETKAKLRAKAAKAELLSKRKEAKLFADDEEKFGTIIATIKEFQRSENLKQAQIASSALIGLQKSENSAMQAIGKAAALVQIAIDTQRGAIAAYSSLAGIPIVGPGLGIAAAAALTLYGAERAIQVTAAAQGGVVGGSGFGDTQPFMLTPGELVVPKQNFEEVVSAISNQRANQGQGEEGGGATEAVARIQVDYASDEAADIITVQTNEQRYLGISQGAR